MQSKDGSFDFFNANPQRIWLAGLVAILSLCSLSPVVQANEGFKLAGGDIVGRDPKSIFQINRHTNSNLTQSSQTANRQWTTGWSHLRYFETTEGDFVVLVKNNNGKLHVRRVNPDGSLGSTPGTWTLPGDVTSLEVLYPTGGPVLMLHVRSSGQLILRRLNSNGSIGAVITNNTVQGLIHKDIVKPYKVGRNWYLFSYARFYGSMHVYRLNANGAFPHGAQPVQAKTWTKGWSNVEFYEADDNTFAILYKNSDAHGQQDGGLIGVKRMKTSNGSFANGWHQRPGGGRWSKGYTEFKIFRAPEVRGRPGHLANLGEPSASGLFLLVYKVSNGNTKTLRLSAEGIGDTIHSGTMASGWQDMASMHIDGKFYLAKVTEDSQARTLSPAMTERFAEVVRKSCPETMGFQFGLSQHGQLAHLEAGGFAKNNSSEQKVMATTDRHATASVGKMFTAFTLLRMIDEGVVGLHDPMLNHLPSDVTEANHADYYFLDADAQMDESVADVRLSELATYTARFGKSGTRDVLELPRAQDKCGENNIDNPGWLPNPNYRCNSGYQNSAYGMLGFAMHHRAGLSITGEPNPLEWQNFTHDLWMRDIHTNFQCNNSVDDTNYYAPCNGAKTCTNGLREVAQSKAKYCVSGSWRSNAEDLMRFLWAVRYGKGLSDSSHELLTSKTLMENADSMGSVYFGWNSAPEFAGTSLTGLSKTGGSAGVAAHIYQLPYGIDASIIRNTSGLSCTGVGSALKQGFEAAIED